MSYKTAIKTGVSLLFLAYLFFNVDIRKIVDSLLIVKPTWYVLSIIVCVVNTIVLAQKYKIVMQPSGIYQSLWQLIRINFVCRFYSMFLSTPVGQGLIRWHLSTKNQAGRVQFLAVMVFERSTFLFALCLSCLISAILTANGRAHEILDHSFLFLLVGLLGLALIQFLIVFPPACKKTANYLLNLKTRARKDLLRRVFGVLSTFSIFCNKKRILLWSLFFAILWHTLFVARIYFVVLSIQAPLDLVHLAWMASLVLLLQTLPISLNGIGVREAAYAFFFELFQLPAEKGVATGILCFTHMLIMSAVGALLHLLTSEQSGRS
jgi:hypothetical protein